MIVPPRSVFDLQILFYFYTHLLSIATNVFSSNLPFTGSTLTLSLSLQGRGDARGSTLTHALSQTGKKEKVKQHKQHKKSI